MVLFKLSLNAIAGVFPYNYILVWKIKSCYKNRLLYNEFDRLFGVLSFLEHINFLRSSLYSLSWDTHVLNEWQGSLYVDYKWQNVSLEILWLLLGRYNLSLMTFSPSWGCPNVSDFYVIHNSPFHDYFSSEDRTTRLTVTPRFKQYTDYFKGKAYRWNWSWLIAPHKNNFSRTFTAPLFEIIKFTRCPYHRILR